MQEWVDTLRLKLREMKILSPKENLYSKLPEIRPPLLPTRDPNSPLPATPPVPAAIVPGVERIVNTTQTSRLAVTYSSVVTTASTNAGNTVPIAAIVATTSNQIQSESLHAVANNVADQQSTNNRPNPNPASSSRNSSDTDSSETNDVQVTSSSSSPPPMSSTSNTLTSNLIKMLYPVTTYCHQSNSVFSDSVISLNESDCSNQSFTVEKTVNGQTSETDEQRIDKQSDENVSSLARTFANNVLADPNTSLNAKRTQTVASTSNKPDSGGSFQFEILTN